MRNIKLLRLAAKLSQAELAEMLNVTQQMISLYENSDNGPSLLVCDKICNIARKYGIDLSMQDIANDYL
jgi:transcriptional regulator with XRE-family HTH domain